MVDRGCGDGGAAMTAPVESVTVPEMAPEPAICAMAPRGVMMAMSNRTIELNAAKHNARVKEPRTVCFDWNRLLKANCLIVMPPIGVSCCFAMQLR